MTTRKPRAAARSRAVNEPLLPLWRAVRAAWAAEAGSEKDNGPTVRAYRAAFAAFNKVKPTTTLGLFLTLLHTDNGDDFADEHPAAPRVVRPRLDHRDVTQSRAYPSHQ